MPRQERKIFMDSSNVFINSNVFLTKSVYPWFDPNFFAQITDYDLLKKLEGSIKNGNAKCSKLQNAILNSKGCLYAKNVRWGIDSCGRLTCNCINKECPHILECNPNYSDEYVARWTTPKEEKYLYRSPMKVRSSHLVNIIHNEERAKYPINPKNEGYTYTLNKGNYTNTDWLNEAMTNKTRWKFVDNSDYEAEELVSVHGCTSEVDKNTKFLVRKKAKRIEKMNNIQQRPISNVEKESISKCAMSEHIKDTIKLEHITKEYIGSTNTIILLNNPAELAFVSRTLLVNEVDHGIYNPSIVMLALADDCEINTKFNRILISNAVLKANYKAFNTKVFGALSQKNKIIQLQINDHDYFLFIHNNFKRWTCRNMYGVTHVCVTPDDIEDISSVPNGLFPITLVYNGKSFDILSEDENSLGKLKIAFTELINSLKDCDEIYEFPKKINGLSLRKENGRVDILGMGHFEFTKY